MGKVIEKIKVASIFEPSNFIELDALVDTGATMLILPRNIITGLGVQKIREINVK